MARWEGGRITRYGSARVWDTLGVEDILLRYDSSGICNSDVVPPLTGLMICDFCSRTTIDWFSLTRDGYHVWKRYSMNGLPCRYPKVAFLCVMTSLSR